jgi:hypothetical protein
MVVGGDHDTESRPNISLQPTPLGGIVKRRGWS